MRRLEGRLTRAERATGARDGLGVYHVADLAAVLEELGRRSDPAALALARRELATDPELRAAWLASGHSLECVFLDEDDWRL